MLPWGTVCQGPLPIGSASITHILQKLFIIFGMVACFNVLMQYFYQVAQGNNEKVPSFVTWLEGTLNWIQLQCLRGMTDLQVQHHLKDCLFHGIHKAIHDSVWYLYSTPGTSYSQLMVAARKAVSENEETQERVRARAMMTTDLGEGMAKLGWQIAKLMAELTQTGQGSTHSSAPASP